MKAQGTQLSLFETRSSSDPFAVRVSARARRLTARVHVGGRVEIVVPVGVNARAVRDFVQRFTPWIDRKVAAMQCFAEPAGEPCPSASISPTPASVSRWNGSNRAAARAVARRARHGSSVRAPDYGEARERLQELAQAGGGGAAGAAAAQACGAI